MIYTAIRTEENNYDKKMFVVARSSSFVALGIIRPDDTYGTYDTLKKAKASCEKALKATKIHHNTYRCKKLGDNFKIIRPKKINAKT